MKTYKLLMIYILIGLGVFFLSRTTDALQGQSLCYIYSLMGLTMVFFYGILPRLK